MKCPVCGNDSNTDDRCDQCAAWLPLAPEDRATSLAHTALLLALTGIATFGVTTLLAAPVALWALLSGRRRGVQPFRADTAIVFIVLAALGLYMGHSVLALRNKTLARDLQMDCVSGIRNISVAARLYAEDHDGVAPPPDTWMESLRPYAKGLSLQCPAARPGTFGYAYNSGAAGRKWAKGSGAAELVAFFDGKPGRNVSGGLEVVEPRHHIGQSVAVFAFADGHSRAATPESAKAFLWHGDSLPRAPSEPSAADRAGARRMR